MTYSNNLNHAYEFGPYRLDFSKRVLNRGDEIISLAPKATELLMMLVANAGELVEKDELLKEVWPDTFVEESNLTQNIFTLRRALGDERADPRYIETVVRRGYRFIAPVRTIGADEQQAADSEPKENASDRPVVAVLPFLNTTGDPELEYLAEGVTDNIINSLSRVSKLRVMSHNAVFRHKAQEVDPQKAGKILGAHAVLIGTLTSRPKGIVIRVELVEVLTGWQLWGELFDSNSTNLLEIQHPITRKLLTALRSRSIGGEENRMTARYTENPQAYQSYLEGRYHWSRYTKKGIEKAIGLFRHAIKLDPNYALAYAGIVDCYLRLAANYLPPEDDQIGVSIKLSNSAQNNSIDESNPRIKLRFEWDWKGAERELRRAHELRADYPTAHQWCAALSLAQRLLQEVWRSNATQPDHLRKRNALNRGIPTHIPSLELTPNEQVQVYCAIAREQIDIGNYDAACMILRSWWQLGSWRKLDGLNEYSCADLLFTAGELAGCVASTKQLPKGQKYGEALLSGSIALWEQLGSKIQAAEGRIELALCYYRQGLFDLGRSTLVSVLKDLSAEDDDLRSLALIRLASLERHAGRLQDALARLTEAIAIVELSGPWVTGRCYLEFASTYKDLAVSYELDDYFNSSKEFYTKALYQFEAVGNHRLAAIVENNLGYLLLSMGKYSNAESHLLRARRNFASFHDKIRCAQSNDSLARLYLEHRRFEEAEEVINRAVQTMEIGDEDALLAEALITKGTIYCRCGRYLEAKRALEDAHRLASRCGDMEGAGRALLVLMEEMRELLGEEERKSVGARLVELLLSSQQPSLLRRLRNCVDSIAL